MPATPWASWSRNLGRFNFLSDYLIANAEKLTSIGLAIICPWTNYSKPQRFGMWQNV